MGSWEDQLKLLGIVIGLGLAEAVFACVGRWAMRLRGRKPYETYIVPELLHGGAVIGFVYAVLTVHWFSWGFLAALLYYPIVGMCAGYLSAVTHWFYEFVYDFWYGPNSKKE